MVSNSPKRREKTGDGELEAGNAETQGHSLGCEGKDTDGEGARRMQDQASQPSLQASEPLPGPEGGFHSWWVRRMRGQRS